MKSVFLVLVLANIVAGAWLLLGTPVDVVREPGRVDLQVDPARLRVVSEAEFARKRDQAQKDAAAAAAPAPAPASSAPAAATPAQPPAAPARGIDLPLASCIDIGSFASDAATRKIRARLATAGLGEHLSAAGTDKATHLHITGVDAAGEAQIHLILRDFPKQEMSHCSDAAPAR